VDAGEHADVEEAAAPGGGAGESGDEREDRFRGVVPAPEKGDREDPVLRSEKREVALGVAVGRVLEPRVAHHPVVVAVVGEAGDGRHEQLCGEDERGGGDRGGEDPTVHGGRGARHVAPSLSAIG
jgi:hypothetical protein